MSLAKKVNQTIHRIGYLAVVVLWLLTACQADGPTPIVPVTATPDPNSNFSGLAEIESIELQQSATTGNIAVFITGQRPDQCASIDVQETRTDNKFEIAITLRGNTLACTGEPVPFERTVPLTSANLSTGIYEVDVNGLTEEFAWAPIPAAVTVDPNARFTITGRVWEDFCPATGLPSTMLVDNTGCIVTDENLYLADRTLSPSEVGFAGITLTLGQGRCPLEGFATTTSSSDGSYIFTDIPPGTYCLLINEIDPANAAIFGAGQWSYPPNGVGGTNITVTNDNAIFNFGWDPADS